LKDRRTDKQATSYLILLLLDGQYCVAWLADAARATDDVEIVDKYGELTNSIIVPVRIAVILAVTFLSAFVFSIKINKLINSFKFSLT
jgi:hypothetical protein